MSEWSIYGVYVVGMVAGAIAAALPLSRFSGALAFGIWAVGALLAPVIARALS